MSYIRELGHWKGALPFSVAPKNTSIWKLSSELCQCDRSMTSRLLLWYQEILHCGLLLALNWPFTTIGWSSGWFLANEILSSLHFSLFSFTLLSEDHWATSSAICCALLSQPLGTTSDDVVSSTYFHSLAFKLSLKLRSLIRMRKSQGPSFVPWGAPEGAVPHSEKHPSANLIRCKRFSQKVNNPVNYTNRQI